MKYLTILLIMAFSIATAVAQSPALNCYRNLDSEASLAPIKNKVSLSLITQPTLQMLANNAKPTQNERKTILIWEDQLSKCNEEAKTYWSPNLDPQAYQILLNSFSTLRPLIADLYAGKISYGVFLKNKQSQDELTSSQIAQVRMRLQAEKERQAQIREESLRLRALQEEAIRAANQSNEAPYNWNATSGVNLNPGSTNRNNNSNGNNNYNLNGLR